MERYQLRILHTILACKLPGHELRIQAQSYVSRTETKRGLQRGDGAFVFGLVVRPMAERSAARVQFDAGLVVHDDAVRRRTGIPTRRAIRICDDRQIVLWSHALGAKYDLHAVVANRNVIDEVTQERLLFGQRERLPAIKQARQ